MEAGSFSVFFRSLSCTESRAKATGGVFLGDLPQAFRLSCVLHYPRFWPYSHGAPCVFHWRWDGPYFPPKKKSIMETFFILEAQLTHFLNYRHILKDWVSTSETSQIHENLTLRTRQNITQISKWFYCYSPTLQTQFISFMALTKMDFPSVSVLVPDF